MIFDFDGTIADTLNSIKETINSLSDEYGYPKITGEDIENYRNKGAKKVIKESGIPMIRLLPLIRKIRIEINKKTGDQKPFSNIKKILEELEKKGYKLGIVTSSPKDGVIRFLKKNRLDVFNFVYSSSSIFSKHRVFNRVLERYNFKNDEVIYVGDEVSDVEAARKAKIKIIAVTWGINSKEVLRENNPDFLIDDPTDLLSIL